MATTNDVNGRLPGLQFRVESSNRVGAAITGTQRGKIVLVCEFNDIKLFEAAAAKLNGFKLFSELAEEITDALGAELDSTDQQLRDALAENTRLAAEGAGKDLEIGRLRRLLASLDDELDGQGEAFFNDSR